MGGEELFGLAVILQAFNDANGKYNNRKKWCNKRETRYSQLWLTGNYNRERLEEISQIANIDVNYLVKLASTTPWGKKIGCKYFGVKGNER